ncbi:MAG TPA: UrcA family protein [Steroidobacteraceae bacterium]|jgi:UrcA family protein|nr:UrcA family protein [Steroidobacteraceae bacterium]
MWHKTTISIKAAAAAVLLAGAWQGEALAAGQAAAPASADVRQVTVHFGDLRIDRPAGAGALYRRIRHAAESVCGDPNSPDSHLPSPSRNACVAGAVERAVAAVDQPALTAYYRDHGRSGDRSRVGVRLSSVASKSAGE